MFWVRRRRKSRLVDIFVDKSHSLFCYVQFVQVHNQSTIFLFSIRFYSRFFLLPCLQEAIWNWRIMLTAPPSIWEHVESQFFSRCNADIFPSSVTPCARQLLCSHSPIENVLAQSGVSQYNSLEQASVGAGVGEVSPATSRDQLNTTRWRFYDGQDWDTGHWWWPTPAWLWPQPHPLTTYWLGPLLCLNIWLWVQNTTDVLDDAGYAGIVRQKRDHFQL